jgi:DNA-directed RNA polymerase subunit beta'
MWSSWKKIVIHCVVSKPVERVNADGKKVNIVIGRSTEVRIVDVNTGITLTTGNIPYGSNLYIKPSDKVKKGDMICDWDPYNAIIVSEFGGTTEFEHIKENVTYREESDEQTGFREKVIIESKDKTLSPMIKIVDKKGEVLKTYNIPVGAHIVINEGAKIEPGTTLVKIPRVTGKTGDITGGLPRVTELFEARNPSNPAVVSEIDGIVSFGKIKRGNREVVVEAKTGEQRRYLVNLSKHILVQENDFVKAGDSLSDGAVSPGDILAIKGPTAVQEYLVNEIQEVYRLQGQKLNDKHFETIVRQMMRKVEIVDPGDTMFLEQQLVNKVDFMSENDNVFGKKVVVDPGDSTELKRGQIITARKLRDENSVLKRKDMKVVESRDAVPATANPILQGITRASLQTSSWISAASFQETTKVLNEAAVNGKVDTLNGLKENVIVGHLIPAGTGLRQYDKLVIGSKEEYERLMASKEEVEEEA